MSEVSLTLLLLVLLIAALALAYTAGRNSPPSPAPPSPIGTLGSIEALVVTRFNTLGDGAYTATVGAVAGLHRGDGTPPGPDDVLSMQPDGSLELRAPGMAGAYERVTKPSPGLMCFRPVGERSWLVPYVTQTPN